MARGLLCYIVVTVCPEAVSMCLGLLEWLSSDCEVGCAVACAWENLRHTHDSPDVHDWCSARRVPDPCCTIRARAYCAHWASRQSQSHWPHGRILRLPPGGVAVCGVAHCVRLLAVLSHSHDVVPHLTCLSPVRTTSPYHALVALHSTSTRWRHARHRCRVVQAREGLCQVDTVFVLRL
jgi:hypothetical protein